MLKYGTCGKKMDIDLDKMKTTNAKEIKMRIVKRVKMKIVRQRKMRIWKKLRRIMTDGLT